jgi:hypothetical protein
MTDLIEMDVVQNANGFDWDILVKNSEGRWITEGHFRDCDFGRFAFETENTKLDRAYHQRMLAAQDAGEYDCENGHSMLRVFRAAFAEVN